MDLVLAAADRHFLTPYVYPTSVPEENVVRQALSLIVITIVGGYFLYFSFAGLSYAFIFDKNVLKHPQILKNQVRKEIIYTSWAAPFMCAPTGLLFLLEVRGYTKLYDDIEGTWGWFYVILSMLGFLFFNDMAIYWIHRGLHHPLLYKRLHKPHHQWKVPTPFASHAFHPIDGFLQSCPYHIYPFLFPLHKVVYLSLFVIVNVWTISIHDADYRVPKMLRPYVNGSAHHSDHHTFFNCNYGQYFTFWDRIGGSFRSPTGFEGKSPKDEVYAAMRQKTGGDRNTDKMKGM